MQYYFAHTLVIKNHWRGVVLVPILFVSVHPARTEWFHELGNFLEQMLTVYVAHSIQFVKY